MRLHQKVELRLRRLILQPEHQAGKRLPDEVSLADSLGVSRSTLRAAMQKLLQDRLVERRPRVGTFVRTASTASDLGAWSSFTHEMRQLGIDVTTYWYDARWVLPSDEEAGRLDLPPDARVLRVDRVRGWNGQRVVKSRSLLHPRTMVRETEDFDRPLYNLIHERSGIEVEFSRERLSAVLPDVCLAGVLQVATSQPLLLRERLVTDKSFRPVELSTVWYRSDIFPLTLDQRKGPF